MIACSLFTGRDPTWNAECSKKPPVGRVDILLKRSGRKLGLLGCEDLKIIFQNIQSVSVVTGQLIEYTAPNKRFDDI